MIARAALGKPWLFRQAQAALAGEPIPPDPTLLEERELLLRHYRLVCERFGVEQGTYLMRKFACCYAQGGPGARAFRGGVSRVTTGGRGISARGQRDRDRTPISLSLTGEGRDEGSEPSAVIDAVPLTWQRVSVGNATPPRFDGASGRPLSRKGRGEKWGYAQRMKNRTTIMAPKSNRGRVERQAQVGGPEIAAVAGQGMRRPLDLLLLFDQFVEHSLGKRLPVFAFADGGEIAAAEQNRLVVPLLRIVAKTAGENLGQPVLDRELHFAQQAIKLRVPRPRQRPLLAEKRVDPILERPADMGAQGVHFVGRGEAAQIVALAEPLHGGPITPHAADQLAEARLLLHPDHQGRHGAMQLQRAAEACANRPSRPVAALRPRAGCRESVESATGPARR